MEMNMNNIPNHVAIIMDGNGRWAKKRMMPRNYGHKKGASTLIDTVLYANKLGIKYLTVYAFSTENWSRPKEEVEYLMRLPLEFFDSFDKKFGKENIKTKVIGSRERLPKELVDKINEVETLTINNTGITLVIALNYGGRDEIINAVKLINNDVVNNKLNIEDLNEDKFSNYLYTKDIPDVDLMIRTSGEIRISNFLLWQISYSEMYFTSKLWPDFTKNEFNKALEHYKNCSRRFGGLK